MSSGPASSLHPLAGAGVAPLGSLPVLSWPGSLPEDGPLAAVLATLRGSGEGGPANQHARLGSAVRVSVSRQSLPPYAAAWRAARVFVAPPVGSVCVCVCVCFGVWGLYVCDCVCVCACDKISVRAACTWLWRALP